MPKSVKQDRHDLEELDLRPLGYVPTAEAAKILGKSEGYVRVLIYTEHRLRAKKLGDRVYVELASIEEIRPTLRGRGRPKSDT